jgi:hypothetical protein
MPMALLLLRWPEILLLFSPESDRPSAMVLVVLRV